MPIYADALLIDERCLILLTSTVYLRLYHYAAIPQRAKCRLFYHWLSQLFCFRRRAMPRVSKAHRNTAAVLLASSRIR